MTRRTLKSVGNEIRFNDFNVDNEAGATESNSPESALGGHLKLLITFKYFLKKVLVPL